jgi:hypothetical protein
MFSTESLIQMLSMDEPSNDPAEASRVIVPSQWKVLIYDNAGRDILSPVMSVTELREVGVTVHMPLHASRQPLPDVPAVYFVSPTVENIDRIASDVVAGMYESGMYLNFTTSLSRNLLEHLAQRVVESNATDAIRRVMDQYLPMRALDEQLFDLGLPGVLPLLNAPATSEEMIRQTVEEIATGLFGTCATLGVMPYLRFSHGNAAEMTARRLESKLRDAIANSKSGGLFPQDAARPVMLILDRQADFAPMVSHSWLYSALVHDVLDWRLNRITCTVLNLFSFYLKPFCVFNIPSLVLPVF